jgi:hypothetical protein
MKQTIKHFFKSVPILEGAAKRISGIFVKLKNSSGAFPGSEKYWERRYEEGAHSGAGSYGLLAEFKADVLNAFVARHDVDTVIEFGCGDGNQLRQAKYKSYRGYDVSNTAIRKCKELFQTDEHKSFYLMSEYNGEKSDLSISLDVVYHLVEDVVFNQYMRTLFEASNAYVIIYSSNSESNDGYISEHVRHRKFTNWIERHLANWRLVDHVPNLYPYDAESQEGSFADFFIFQLDGEKQTHS